MATDKKSLNVRVSEGTHERLEVLHKMYKAKGIKMSWAKFVEFMLLEQLKVHRDAIDSVMRIIGD